MSVGISVKKYEGYNQALGCYVTSKRDFMNKMKAAGCDFIEKVKVKDTTPPPFKQSKWAKDMISTAVQARKGKKAWVPGDRFLDQLKKSGMDNKSKEKAMKMAKDQKVGGFN